MSDLGLGHYNTEKKWCEEVLEEEEELNKSFMDRVMDDAQKVEKGSVLPEEREVGLSHQKRRTWHKAFLLAYTAMDFLKVNGLMMKNQNRL